MASFQNGESPKCLTKSRRHNKTPLRKKRFTRVLSVLGVGILLIESSNVLAKRIAVYKDNIAHKLRLLVRLLA